MSTSSLKIVFTGEALKSGQMNVRELAPALLAFGEMLEKTNAALNGDLATVQVNVKSDFERGSFGVDLDVIQAVVDNVTLLASMGNVRDSVGSLCAMRFALCTRSYLGVVIFKGAPRNDREGGSSFMIHSGAPRLYVGQADYRILLLVLLLLLVLTLLRIAVEVGKDIGVLAQDPSLCEDGCPIPLSDF